VITSLVLVVVMIVIAAALTIMGLVTSLSKLARARNDRRQERRYQELRPRLLEAIDDPGVRLNLSPRDEKALIAITRNLLLALRGDDRAAVVDVLEREGVVNVAVRQTHARSAVRRARAVELLGAAGVERAAPRLRQLLQDSDRDVRRCAARSLGLIGHPGAIPDLLRIIDEGRIPLNTVTMAIARIGPIGVGALVDACSYGSPLVRATCAELLGLNGTTHALRTLTTLLRNDDDLEVRIRAARALGRIGAPTSVDPLAEALRESEPAALRAVAAKALGNIGGVRTISVLRDALNAPQLMVARNAAHALAAVGPAAHDTLELAARGRANSRSSYAREALSAQMLRELVAADRGEG
jgi:HEAT repeat protein